MISRPLFSPTGNRRTTKDTKVHEGTPSWPLVRFVVCRTPTYNAQHEFASAASGHPSPVVSAPSNDAATTALITNEEVLEVDQHSSGGHQGIDRWSVRVWTARAAGSEDIYVAAFNLAGTMQSINLGWAEVGIHGSEHSVRNLWTHQGMDRRNGIHVNLRPHASVLYRVSAGG